MRSQTEFGNEAKISATVTCPPAVLLPDVYNSLRIKSNPIKRASGLNGLHCARDTHNFRLTPHLRNLRAPLG